MAERDPTRDPDSLHYAVERLFGYPPAPLFEIAADVERYPEFLPGWKAVRKRPIADDEYATDQLLALGPLRERFTSRTYLERPERIRVVSQSHTFRHFEVDWRFAPLGDTSCLVHLDAHLDFASRHTKRLVGGLVARQIDAILAAFERRARDRLGPPAMDPGANVHLERLQGTVRRR